MTAWLFQRFKRISQKMLNILRTHPKELMWRKKCMKVTALQKYITYIVTYKLLTEKYYNTWWHNWACCQSRTYQKSWFYKNQINFNAYFLFLFYFLHPYMRKSTRIVIHTKDNFLTMKHGKLHMKAQTFCKR